MSFKQEKMQRATFYVNICYEDDPQFGSWGSISGRYQFWIDFPDEIYEELYQVWYNNDCHLNNWNINWDGHDKLYNTINQIATEMLNKIMQEKMPELGTFSQYDTLWELSKETADAF